MTLWNILGSLGALAIISAYALLQAQRWSTDQIRYSVTNAVGASLILVSLVVEPNIPAILIESFWLLISIWGFWRARGKTSC